MFGTRSAARWIGCSTGSRAVLHLPSWRQMFKPDPAWRDEGFFAFSAPAVDVTEDDKAYKITAELPGLDEKNIDVTVSGDMLTLKGEKHYEKDEKDKNHYMSERAYGSFQRDLRAARRHRSGQDRRRTLKGRADDHAAKDGGSAEAAEEDRGQGCGLIR